MQRLTLFHEVPKMKTIQAEIVGFQCGNHLVVRESLELSACTERMLLRFAMIGNRICSAGGKGFASHESVLN